jgi:hypothetical protein
MVLEEMTFNIILSKTYAIIFKTKREYENFLKKYLTTQLKCWKLTLYWV